ncbi:MAG: NUDIX domain-containing protein [Roseiflexaceae bacterium]|nr:NUDIX domain-containing protein [Roseiflexaceae bacterium]
MNTATHILRATVVLPDRDTLLLLRHEGAGWFLPSTLARADETVQQAAQRAVLEATGVAVALTNLVGIYSGTNATVEFVFTAYTTPDRVRAPDGVELDWLHLSQAEHLAGGGDAPNLSPSVLADVRRGFRFPLGVLTNS